MSGFLQPLDQKFAIVDKFGNPTEYFIRWAQQRQIDIGDSITLADLQTYLDAHVIVAGTGIQFAPGPNGDLNSNPTIHADAQAILDEITATRGAVLYRGLLGWAGLLPGTAGYVLSTNGAGADPTWVAQSGGGGGMGVLLSSQTVSGVANVIFDNTLITATYDNYLLRIKNVSYSVVASGQVQLSPDNGTTWRAAGYNNSFQQLGLTTAFSSYNQNLLTTGLLFDWSSATGDATLKTNGQMELWGLPTAALKKLSIAQAIGKASDNNIYHRMMGGEWPTAEAINAIRYNPTLGTVSGTFELWGML